MKKILLISEVASLGRALERQVKQREGTTLRSTITAASFGLNKERLEGLLVNTMSDDSTTGGPSEAGGDATKRVIDPDDR